MCADFYFTKSAFAYGLSQRVESYLLTVVLYLEPRLLTPVLRISFRVWYRIFGVSCKNLATFLLGLNFDKTSKLVCFRHLNLLNFKLNQNLMTEVGMPAELFSDL
jgi:hypothetical protein